MSPACRCTNLRIPGRHTNPKCMFYKGDIYEREWQGFCGKAHPTAPANRCIQPAHHGGDCGPWNQWAPAVPPAPREREGGAPR